MQAIHVKRYNARLFKTLKLYFKCLAEFDGNEYVTAGSFKKTFFYQYLSEGDVRGTVFL